MMYSFIFYVLPNIKRNPELWTQEDMVSINDFLSKTLKDFTGEETMPKDYTPEALIAAYTPYCLGNRVEIAEKIYKRFNCKKSRCVDDFALYIYYDELWDSYNEFDISDYEMEWMQEEFSSKMESIHKESRKYSVQACYELDLLEKIGTYENYKLFMDEIEKYKDYEYILYRLSCMYPNIVDEDLRKRVQDFCEQLQIEIKEKKGDNKDE